MPEKTTHTREAAESELSSQMQQGGIEGFLKTNLHNLTNFPLSFSLHMLGLQVDVLEQNLAIVGIYTCHSADLSLVSSSNNLHIVPYLHMQLLHHRQTVGFHIFSLPTLDLFHSTPGMYPS